MVHDKLPLLAIPLLVVVLYIKRLRQFSLPLPPGPRKLPLLGNLLDLPRDYEWETYARWSREFDSDVIHISAGGSDIVVLNSLEAVDELLEKRSSKYSSRPRLTMVSELMGWNWLTSSMAYGERWRERRRIFTKHFNSNNASLHRPVIMEFIHKMLVRLKQDPENFMSITRHTIGGMTLSLAYGLPIHEEHDPYIALADEAIASLTSATIPGTYLVDALPILKFLPSWMPGAGFRRKAKVWRQLQERFRNSPFEFTKRSMAAGDAKPSFTSISLQNIKETAADKAHQEEVIKDVAGMVFTAGADASLSSVQTLFLAMVTCPKVQQKAHEELDRVLGGRLPDFNDEADLPYIGAIVKEILRWQTTGPVAVPHFASEDDVYNGYHIPKGAVVIGNSWALLHDEKTYPDPFTFNPERYLMEDGKLDPGVQDPAEIAFGYGRRMCPGRHTAMSILWLSTATVLSTYQISKSVDENGFPIEAKIKYTSALVCRPEPFQCTIKPRSNAAAALIESVVDSC